MSTIKSESPVILTLNVVAFYIAYKACPTRWVSAEQKFTRDYWRKQVLPVCGDVSAKALVKMARVNCSADTALVCGRLYINDIKCLGILPVIVW